MKQSTVILITVAIVVGAVWLTWWQRGEMKDREFVARLAAAPHKTDSTRTVLYITQPRRDSTLHAKPLQMTHADSARIDSAFSLAWKGGKDSTLEFIDRISARARTSVKFDSVGTVDAEFDPLTRLFTIGLQPAPTRQINTKITDSATVPIIEHDSWTTRATLVTAGAVAGALIMAIAH